jgi:hypothetical protein
MSVPFGPTLPSNEKGHPSAVAVKAIGEIKFARPIDFFKLKISPAYISNVCKGTNYHASAEGDGIEVTRREAKEFGDRGVHRAAGVQYDISVADGNQSGLITS